MTRQKSFKQRVRQRMAKTGESYTAARRVLIPAQGPSKQSNVQSAMRIADKKIVAATGRGWQEWFTLLDKWGATRRSHTEIARWLVQEHGVAGWWSQTVAGGYEQARGMREPGQRHDGAWAVSVTKTVAAPLKVLYDAFVDAKRRALWLPDAQLRLRKALPHKSARYDWGDGTTRVNVFFDEPGKGKSRIAISHERLVGSDAVAEMKAWWRKRIVKVKPFVEGGESDA